MCRESLWEQTWKEEDMSSDTSEMSATIQSANV